jgi:hypothetical protein
MWLAMVAIPTVSSALTETCLRFRSRTAAEVVATSVWRRGGRSSGGEEGTLAFEEDELREEEGQHETLAKD